MNIEKNLKARKEFYQKYYHQKTLNDMEVSNMEWKEKKQGTVWKYDNEGDQIEGKFLRTENGKYGDNYILDCKGEDYIIFGNTVLNTKLQGIQEGTMLRITYIGEKKGADSGRVYKDFKVETQE